MGRGAWHRIDDCRDGLSLSFERNRNRVDVALGRVRHVDHEFGYASGPSSSKEGGSLISTTKPVRPILIMLGAVVCFLLLGDAGSVFFSGYPHLYGILDIVGTNCEETLLYLPVVVNF